MFNSFKRPPVRKIKLERKTKETGVSCYLNIDGEGKAEIKTGIGLLDHMLELFAFHGLFDLKLIAKGDLKVDLHHTNEDVGIVLGQAFKKALGAMRGIKRMGSASVPMEEAVATVTVDISGRGQFAGGVRTNFSKALVEQQEDNYNWSSAEHFFESFAKQGGINLIIKEEVDNITDAKTGFIDFHAVLEPIFKALGLALDQATQIDPRRKGVPSTKGIID